MPKEIASGERLDSWKEIAAYLKRNERTAIRWEKEKGLPIRRIPGGERQGVFAYREELDKWLAGSDHTIDDEDANRTSDNGSIDAPIVLRDPPLGFSASTAPATEGHPQAKVPYWRRAGYLAAGFSVALCLVAAYGYIHSRFWSRTPQLIKQEQLTTNEHEKQGLVTDGKALYFGQEQNGWFALATMPVDGGPIRLLWNPQTNVFPVDISEDGRRLLALTSAGVEWNRDLWIVPLDGGEPRNLAKIKAHAAAWSPDSKIIAIAAENEIYFLPDNGSPPTKIASFTALPFSLLWSRDGKRLYFALFDIATHKFPFWGQLSGDGMRTITLRPIPPSMEGCTDWAKVDGADTYSVCAVEPKPLSAPICMVRFGTKWWEPSLQVVPLHFVQGEPNAIAFAENRSRLFVLHEQEARAMFVRYDPHLQAFRQILPGVSGTFLDYSQDGKWVAYVSLRDDSLWISKADGSNPQQLTIPPEEIELPRWSQDRRQIAYMSRRPNHSWRILIQQFDSGVTREASVGNDNQGAPTWSPDGRFLVYGRVDCENIHTCEIHRINLATGEEEALPGSEGLSTARWSPNGLSIAALDLERHQLMLFNVKTEKWQKLADSLVRNDLSWSADSKYLYASIPGTEARIVRIRVQDGYQETVLAIHSLDKLDLAAAGDLQFSVSPDDSVILHRQIRSEEIYSYDLERR